MSEMTERDREFQELAEGAADEYLSSSPEEQVAFKRRFLFAMTAGILSAIQQTEGETVEQPRVELRERIRNRMREHIEANPGQTALTKLVDSQVILVEEYDALAEADERFRPEAEMARATKLWGQNEPLVDESLAQEVFDYIKV